jgi:hypothetical protein
MASMKLKLGEKLGGPTGTAQEVLMDGEPGQPAWVATQAIWFLDCPGQSVAWDRYILIVDHLRPIPETPPANLRFPSATHEVTLAALDPGRSPVPTDHETWVMLHPLNVSEQVEVPNDDEARLLARLAAQAVVDGTLWAEPPLSGQKEPWRTSLIKSAAHARGEEHAP